MKNYFTSKVKVRYNETDQMGVVHHGNYASYFEIGRTDFIKNSGISYKEMELKGIIMPVTELKMNYKKPAYYDDTLEIRTFLKNLSAAKIEFYYEVYNDKNELVCTAESTNAFIDKETGKLCRAPQFLINMIKKNHNLA